jgi:hypothetical protein
MYYYFLTNESFLAASAIFYLLMWWWGGNISGIVLGVRGFFIVLSGMTLTILFVSITKFIIVCCEESNHYIRDEELYS